VLLALGRRIAATCSAPAIPTPAREHEQANQHPPQSRFRHRHPASRIRGRSGDEENGKMPKMKTHSGAAKRFRKTGTGKIVRQKANKQHILTKKRTKRKRGLRQDDLVQAADVARVKRMIPGL